MASAAGEGLLYTRAILRPFVTPARTDYFLCYWLQKTVAKRTESLRDWLPKRGARRWLEENLDTVTEWLVERTAPRRSGTGLEPLLTLRVEADTG